MRMFILLAVFFSFCLIAEQALSGDEDVQIAPDGTYVHGTPRIAPDGSYVGGTPRIAPDGSYGTGTPRIAPDRSGWYIRKRDSAYCSRRDLGWR